MSREQLISTEGAHSRHRDQIYIPVYPERCIRTDNFGATMEFPPRTRVALNAGDEWRDCRVYIPFSAISPGMPRPQVGECKDELYIAEWYAKRVGLM